MIAQSVEEPNPAAEIYLPGTINKRSSAMPVLLVPLLVGIPVVLGGGYIIYHFAH
jgi:hypothetical protein